MEWFAALEVTEAGLPLLHDNEIQIYSQHHVDVYQDEEKLLRNGRLMLTSHRILWLQEGSGGRKLAGELSKVLSADHEGGFLKRSPKLRLMVNLSGTRNGTIKFSFKEKGSREFQEPLTLALQRRAWVDVGPSRFGDKRVLQHGNNAVTTAAPAAPAGYGIAGILDRKKREMEEEKALVGESMNDLSALMQNAKDLVALMDRYTHTNKSLATRSGGEDSEQLDALLFQLGIKNPVTKESSGVMYHRDLARQLSVFLKERLTVRGVGMMTLTDVYCIYNRARGISLISPDDLLEAARLLGPLKLGMRLVKFDSGVLVIQLDSFSEAEVARKLEEMASRSKRGWITSSDVATHFRVSVALGMEYLLVAERQGLLCRDDALEGLLFFSNKFPSFSYSLAH